MNTRISYLSCIVLGLIFPGAAVSQSMGDRSSVYNAMWFDDTNVYVTGQIAGLMSVHIYAVDLTLQTPSGTNISSYPSFSPGWVVNTVMAPWTADDLGADFLATVQDRFYCVPGRTYYSLAFAQLKQRPKLPKYSCTAELTNICSDATNGQAPLGPRKGSPTCHLSNYCCSASNTYISGWCREETCQKVFGQPVDTVVSQCMNKAACQDPTVYPLCPQQ
jgi:hypothetical protein